MRRIQTFLAGVLCILLALGLAAWARFNSNINRVDVTKALGQRPTPSAGLEEDGPLNILVLGSDTRQGIGTTRWGTDTVEGGAHSDTNLLVHISADRSAVTVVSIPRDSMVPAPPGCSATVPTGQWTVRQWNQNYHEGGVGCTIRAFEGNTGIYVNHYAVVDFRGFADMVDALGGVTVCTPVAIDDRDSGLRLSPGRHRLDGEQALGYVRVRKTVGDGSDLGRIKRQQAFMSSVAQEATKTSLLLRPDRLYRFLDAATQSLTTDPEFDLGTMRDVASSARSLGVDQIRFVTVPTEQYPADHNRVQWKASASLIWAAIKDDRVVGAPRRTTSSPTSSSSSSSGSTQEPELTVSPEDIRVLVVNSAGVTGLGRQVAGQLQTQGFRSVSVRNGPLADAPVTVTYPAGMAEAARTVAAAFPGARVVEGVTGGPVVVTLGPDAPDVAELPNRIGSQPLPSSSLSPAPTETIEQRTAAQDICS